MSDEGAKKEASKLKRILIVVGILGALLILLARPMLFMYFRWKIKPGKPFAETTAPKAPDYSQSSSWAALPDHKDYADATPANVSSQPENKRRADTFFIYPTTYMSGKSWNADINEKTSKTRVDTLVMKHQASAFNACCKVYAPRYRQATLYFAMGFEPDGKKALELAYSDVVRAFKYYLKHWNKGRPFIIAGHSQGSIHGLRLIEEHVAKNPTLRKQLIAAYFPGNPIHKDKFKRSLAPLTVCKEPTTTHCLISWHTLGKDGDVEKYNRLKKFYPPNTYEDVKGRDHICVNPITWKAEDPNGPLQKHLGAIQYHRGDKSIPEPIASTVSGGCVKRAMRVTEVRLKGFDRMLFGPGDYHIYDYNLFYMNIRKNALERTNAYFAKYNKKKTTPPTKRPPTSAPKQ
ncbi:MAG TPA: DUF3089 domain-containing protein [Myxococcales bacterium]|nr:hypothetical protein [Deltaproteobacteria bacterium]HAA53610.1 DUF3089 domain-containing protein [Myxococcales bacterium]|tara:strand:- start:9769 stop:10980 length:1212 start_codon:yes stop_codon:yes gene_type:complete